MKFRMHVLSLHETIIFPLSVHHDSSVYDKVHFVCEAQRQWHNFQCRGNQMTSFFICSDDWEKGQEVTLVETESSSEYDNLVMDETKLEDLISDENQKLIYVFDMMSDRVFFMELTEIVPRQSLDKAVCLTTEGNAPIQILADDELVVVPKTTLDENFYGDEDYELDELDEEGFGEMNFDDSSLFSEDPKF
ncbi:MAG: hypothetical protein WCG08_15800 [Paludibacter sp.]